MAWDGRTRPRRDGYGVSAYATITAAQAPRLTGDVLGMCSTLSRQTIEKLLAKSDLEVGLEALGIPRH